MSDSEKNLISIGELSKITGINIKCLRYYDSVDILTPAWVNPDTGYRYYDVSQTAILEVIECCMALDIPLKVVQQFFDADQTHIDTEKMCRYGMEVLKERQQKLNRLQKRMEHLKQEMERGERIYQTEGPVKVHMREFCHGIVPFQGSVTYQNIRALVSGIIKTMRLRGWNPTYNFGLLFLKAKSSWKQYLYVDLCMDREAAEKYKDIIVIERGEYLCQNISEFDSREILQKCRDMIEEEQIELIEVSELYKKDNIYPNTEYEIRIKVKK